MTTAWGGARPPQGTQDVVFPSCPPRGSGPFPVSPFPRASVPYSERQVCLSSSSCSLCSLVPAGRVPFGSQSLQRAHTAQAPRVFGLQRVYAGSPTCGLQPLGSSWNRVTCPVVASSSPQNCLSGRVSGWLVALSPQVCCALESDVLSIFLIPSRSWKSQEL